MILSSKILFAKALSLKGVTIYLVLFYFLFCRNREIGGHSLWPTDFPISLLEDVLNT